MTLFTLVLVLAWERLFKLGEHWQLDYLLEVMFQWLHRVSLAQALPLSLAWMENVGHAADSARDILWHSDTTLLWIIIGLLCSGAEIERQYYHAYLQAVRHGDIHASDQMAEELALIYDLPTDCNEALRLSAL